jgi:hypothetical protein
MLYLSYRHINPDQLNYFHVDEVTERKNRILTKTNKLCRLIKQTHA